MRKNFPDENSVQTRAARGRAVLRCYGAGAADGHLRYTNADGAELYGGSEESHARMREKVIRIQRELREQGIRLDRMTREEYRTAQAIVEKANRE